ncbi:ParB/RepB/Spo0J family partition protein [Amorphus orientalis]|uniref:ParB family chromosome partitioning protein n=1 Tax=Amorphus orientalis TaxID=649198 RepID=A0AAE4AR25_9HYPH|nr:ParB/RepB/Spo0J family partition protein [Amorphus orientalis]MDQ0313737.1 ParB family chromosome partitioning protein [Amorphus orientalis]
MAEDASRKRLGRGLAALLGDVEPERVSEEDTRGLRKVPIDLLVPNPRNPRKTFDETDLSELASSIKDRGVVQPILVRRQPASDSVFEIIAGERRWRAAQKAGLHDVPVVIRDVDDRQALELAIIENVQRADLNAIEEAHGYERLMADFSYTQAELGKVIGKSRSHVANTLRLLKLSDKARTYVAGGELTAGHARALLTAEDPDALADRIVKQGLSVRDAETLAGEKVKSAVSEMARDTAKDADTRALEKRLSAALGLKVTVAHRPTGAGELKVRYRTLEQLDEVIRRLEEAD